VVICYSCEVLKIVDHFPALGITGLWKQFHSKTRWPYFLSDKLLWVSETWYIIHLRPTIWCAKHTPFGTIYLSTGIQSCPQLATGNQERKKDREESWR
jgi:steroid 5-alpha reductase family enzyme